MEPIINISNINDFLYCPKSLYLHTIYSSFDTKVFHDAPQVVGGLVHEAIDQNRYSTSKHILQGLPVYSQKLGVKGKIDIYDAKKQHLIERKYRVKQIYKGFLYQLYAQMYCLEEARYPVKQMSIHSLADNKRYDIPLPTASERTEFEATIRQMRQFDVAQLTAHNCSQCDNTIYSLLNW